MILDTNVLSELTRLQPNDKVMRWFAQQNEQELFTTSISHAEMLLGVKMLAEGKRQSILYQAVVEIFEQDFANKVLAFDTVVVPHYVNVVLARQTIGRPISQCDAQIAAIAECYQATLVTRNTKDFEHCGLTLVNPWL